MFEEMDESAFPEFLAAFWREKGWETSVMENEDGTYMVAGDRESGTRGLIGVRPSDDTEIAASEVENFAAFCDKREVDVRVMATRGRFTTGARSAADAADVHLLDPNELASAVRDEGVEELVTEYTDGSSDADGDDDGSIFDVFPSLPVSVPSGVPSGIPVVPLVVAALVIVAAVFVGPTLLGMIPVVGADGGNSGGSGGPAVTALSLADTNNTTATMRWDVRTQDTITNYTAPEGQTFVVVQFNATAGDDGATLRRSDFVLAVNDTFQPVQEFANVSGTFRAKQLPKRVGPNGSARGVIVFLAPEGFDGATLVETYGGPGVRFERADLEFSV